MSAQSPASNDIRLLPITSKPSPGPGNSLNGSSISFPQPGSEDDHANGPSSASSIQPALQPEQHHQQYRKPKAPSRALRISPAGPSDSDSRDFAQQKQEPNPIVSTSPNTTETIHVTTIGTLDFDAQVSIAQPLALTDASHKASSQPVVTVGVGHVDFHPGVPTSPPSRTASNPPTDYFVPRTPTHRVSNKASRKGRERLYGYHHPRPHHTNTISVNVAEQDKIERRKHWNESDERQRLYWKFIERLDSSDHLGRTLKFHDFAKGLRAQDAKDREAGRAAVIEVFENRRTVQREFSTSKELRDYLNSVESSIGSVWGTTVHQGPSHQPSSGAGTTGNVMAEPKSRRRIFVLEDLPLNFLEIFGSRLHIHPDVFASQYSCDQGWAYTDSLAFLPAGPHDKRRFKLRYSTLMPKTYVQLNRDKPCPPWLMEGGPADWFNPKFNVVRGLETPFDNGDWDYRGKHSELEGQASYWARTYDGGGWDVLLLVDPQFQEPDAIETKLRRPSCTDNSVPTDRDLDIINRYPFQNEECDLPTNPTDWKLPSHHDTPSMTSLYQDILWHYQSERNVLKNITEDPNDCTVILRKIVIIRWIAYLNHLHKCFWHCRGELFGTSDEKGISTKPSPIWAPTWTEWMYNRLQSWSSDLEMYRIDVEGNMRNLGMDPENRECLGRVDAEEAAQWHYIQHNLQRHKFMLKTITDNYVQIIGLRETQTSTEQARKVGHLTILGTVFVPLSIISGILSMGGYYLPGERRFWVYLAVALPVAAVLSLCLLTKFLPYIWSWLSWVWHWSERYKITHDREEHGVLPRFHVLPIRKKGDGIVKSSKSK